MNTSVYCRVMGMIADCNHAHQRKEADVSGCWWVSGPVGKRLKTLPYVTTTDASQTYLRVYLIPQRYLMAITTGVAHGTLTDLRGLVAVDELLGVLHTPVPFALLHPQDVLQLAVAQHLPVAGVVLKQLPHLVALGQHLVEHDKLVDLQRRAHGRVGHLRAWERVQRFVIGWFGRGRAWDGEEICWNLCWGL